MNVTVVVPTYNEAENLPEMVRRLFALPLPQLRLLIVDDASPDGTGLLAEELARLYPGRLQVLHRPRKEGLGRAYLAGFRLALQEGAEVVVQMDADLSHAPEEIPALLQKLEEADVVVGSRYVPGGGVEPGWQLWRRLLSLLGNDYARWVSGLKVKDATSGFKAFRRHVLEDLDLQALQCRGFAFQTELVYACQKKGYRVVEHPIFFRHRHRGNSKISLSIILEGLWRLPCITLTKGRK